MENFVFTEMTAGHALQPVIVAKAFAKSLKAHCKARDCKPVSVAEAVYDFVSENGFAKTFHRMVVQVEPGTAGIAKWLKDTHITWAFGILTETEREI